MRPILVLSLASLVLAVPQTAAAVDRDRDRLPDSWERQNRLSTAKKSANEDQDRDQVDNRNELREGTKPRDRDSDNDGRSDGSEDRDRDGLSNAGEDLTGNDPRLRDTDGDGISDGKEAVGVVIAFEGGVVTIELAVGGTVSARVTEDTELECESEDSVEAGYVGPVLRAKRGRRRGRSHGRKRAGRASVLTSQAPEDEEEEFFEGEEDDEGEDGLEDEDDLEDEEDDELEEEDELDDFSSCAPDALAPGARVSDAEGHVSEAGPTFEYIALVR